MGGRNFVCEDSTRGSGWRKLVEGVKRRKRFGKGGLGEESEERGKRMREGEDRIGGGLRNREDMEFP
ncbi:hypothetical protein Tco_1111765 [Tanacetum coccineum]|uniref:Uncharacterized protein n=1 Tax=Tanacetum coccineum TaxID=301880 RepID=A0ABQ5IPU6_9ASTR